MQNFISCPFLCPTNASLLYFETPGLNFLTLVIVAWINISAIFHYFQRHLNCTDAVCECVPHCRHFLPSKKFTFSTCTQILNVIFQYNCTLPSFIASKLTWPSTQRILRCCSGQKRNYIIFGNGRWAAHILYLCHYFSMTGVLWTSQTMPERSLFVQRGWCSPRSLFQITPLQ